MAAYVKQGDNIVLLLSKAEANALCDFGAAAFLRECEEGATKRNPMTEAAFDRAWRALETACEPSSRSGAAIQ